MSENIEKQVEEVSANNGVSEVIDTANVSDEIVTSNVSSEVVDIKIMDAEKPEEKVEELDILKKEYDVNDAIFITENDTFDVTVRWQKFGNKIYVEEGDSEFDKDNGNINEFVVTFKYPSQGDYEIIMSSGAYRNQEDIKLTDIIQLELARMVTLVRKWSLKQNLSKMVDLDPNIIKAILTGVRNEIGMKAIL